MNNSKNKTDNRKKWNAPKIKRLDIRVDTAGGVSGGDDGGGRPQF